MNESHLAYLNLGSNMQPEVNLPKAVELLSQYGKFLKVSSVWESEAVGTKGPNYLNVCVSLITTFTQAHLKEKVIQTIEARLGRRRGADKFAPRSMDIDIVLFDDSLVLETGWDLAYVMVPLAELCPEFRNPLTGETANEKATRLRQVVWLEAREGVLGGLERDGRRLDLKRF